MEETLDNGGRNNGGGVADLVSKRHADPQRNSLYDYSAFKFPLRSKECLLSRN